MKAHLIDTHLVVPRSRSFGRSRANTKVTLQKTAVSGGIGVSQTQLVLVVLGLGMIVGKGFYAPVSKDRGGGGGIVLPLSVCPSICLSVCTNLT